MDVVICFYESEAKDTCSELSHSWIRSLVLTIDYSYQQLLVPSP